jgi:hypothetical protein
MSELDSKKRTRSKTKNDDDSLNKPQPKKSRGKAIKEEEIKDENNLESNDSLNKPQPKKSRGKAIKKEEIKDENNLESNVSSSLENNDDNSQGKLNCLKFTK